MRNLLANAFKYTPEGKRITVRITDASAARGAVLISIIDEGIGIPENELELIFDKSAQSSTTQNGAGGTVLGLAIAHNLVVEVLGGSAGLDTQLDAGTRVRLNIALQPGTSLTSTQTGSGQSIRGMQ